MNAHRYITGRAIEPKFKGLCIDIRNAVKKSGFCYVYTELLNMYCLLPAWRSTFVVNPFLFKYSLHLTNQQSKGQQFDMLTTIRTAFGYMFDPAYIIKHNESRAEVRREMGEIDFIPNYQNNVDDHVFGDFDRLGIQLLSLFSTYIFLDTRYKTPEDMVDKVCMYLWVRY